MKTVFVSFICVLGVIAWRISGTLSGEAIAMAVGFLFGALAGIPTALLVSAARQGQHEKRNEPAVSPPAYPQLIVFTPSRDVPVRSLPVPYEDQSGNWR